MTLFVLLLLIGLLFGLGGLFTAAKWMLIIWLALWLVGALYGTSHRYNHRR